MKLKEYIQLLNKVAAKNPEALHFDVIYAKDSEGNGYSKVGYEPSLGKFQRGEWISQEEVEENGGKINAICIN